MSEFSNSEYNHFWEQVNGITYYLLESAQTWCSDGMNPRHQHCRPVPQDAMQFLYTLSIAITHPEWAQAITRLYRKRWNLINEEASMDEQYNPNPYRESALGEYWVKALPVHEVTEEVTEGGAE